VEDMSRRAGTAVVFWGEGGTAMTRGKVSVLRTLRFSLKKNCKCSNLRKGKKAGYSFLSQGNPGRGTRQVQASWDPRMGHPVYHTGKVGAFLWLFGCRKDITSEEVGLCVAWHSHLPGQPHSHRGALETETWTNWTE
jgi:hypothetical protein